MKTIKSKISFGVIFLFTVIILLGLLGIIFINQLVQKSKGSIVDNYSSVNYTMIMLKSFDEMYAHEFRFTGTGKTSNSIEDKSYQESKNIFEKNLQSEINNVTEKGENELVIKLHSSYENYRNYCKQFKYKKEINKNDLDGLKEKYGSVRDDILNIYKINMDAITGKTEQLRDTADDVIIYMSIVVTISILITLFFVFKFPSRIVEPIKELTGKIKSISERNYDQKLDVKSKDELGELANAFNIMAEKLKIYEAKQIDRLLFEQKRLEAVVHNFEDGIIFIDERQKIVLVNNTILQMTGLTGTDMLNRSIKDVASNNDLVRELFRHLPANQPASSTETKPIRISRGGKEFFFNIETEDIITYAESEKKETFIGNLILLKNITKFHERDTAKTNLLATVSHELKTPLSSINLSLKLLDDNRLGILNNEQKELINSLRQQSNRLSRVINELLDYSQIESGNIRLKFSRVKPDEVLDIGITALMMQISEKNIELVTHIEEELPDIMADLEKLVFVFINILNNAIRYSKTGNKILIEVRKNNNEIEFSIADNGPGIPKEDLEKLFRRFTQVGKKSKQGWGLGLAISKEFIQAQEGRIWVDSEPGKGSKFIFSIPCLRK